jgi:hypothetical protein
MRSLSCFPGISCSFPLANVEDKWEDVNLPGVMIRDIVPRSHIKKITEQFLVLLKNSESIPQLCKKRKRRECLHQQ